MPLLGLTWDPTFLRTRAGMSLALESGVGLVGALIGFVFANGFESFLMWGAFFASGFFLFTHVTNLTQSLESRFPFLAKVVRFLCFCTFVFIYLKLFLLLSPPAPCLYGCMVFGCGNHGDLQMCYLVYYGGEASISVYFWPLYFINAIYLFYAVPFISSPLDIRLGSPVCLFGRFLLQVSQLEVGILTPCL